MKRRIAVLLSVMVLGCTPLTAFAAENTDSATDSKVTVSEVNADTTAPDTEETETMTEEEIQDQINVTTDEDGNVTFSFGDWEWSSDSDEESTTTGKVTNVSSYLHLRNGAGLNYDIIGHLLPGAEVEVIGEDGDWYQVVVPEQTGYVSKDYLTVLESTENSDSVDEDTLAMLLYMMMLSADSDSGASLTPEGNLTLVDDIGSTSSSGQEFLTFVTKSGNTFYMVIDRNDDGEANVHFLNLVDEADLLSLMDEDTAAQYTTTDTDETVETAEPETEETTEPEVTEEEETTEKKSMALPLILLFLVGVGGVGGFLYFKMNDKKKAPADTADPDADYQDEDEDDAYDIPEDEDYSEEDESYDVEDEE